MLTLCSLSSTSAFICCLKAQGLHADSLLIIFHTLIFSKVEYALPAIAGLLSETGKSGPDVFFQKGKSVFPLLFLFFLCCRPTKGADVIFIYSRLLELT